MPVQIAKPRGLRDPDDELGIGDDTLVVAYDDYDHMFAGRLAWALRYYGHDAVRILDGGWTRWVAGGQADHHAESRERRPVDLHAAAFARRCAARPTRWRRAIETGRRASGRCPRSRAVRGMSSAAGRGGHIPGARNVHYAALVDATTGCFRPRSDLARTFEQAGVDVAHLPPRVIVYCNGGISCTVPLHALQMLGRADVAVYDGSWNEWGPDERRPIQKGPQP